MKKIRYIVYIIIFSKSISAQNLSQNIRGKVIDNYSKQPIYGAVVRVENLSTFTDSLGKFYFSGVSLGRYRLQVSILGYAPETINDIVLVSGKEFYIEIPLEESAQTLAEVTVRTFDQRTPIEKKIAPVSSHIFDVEQTTRFAGNRNDPARMVANFSGVMSNNDTRNDILIRGNSPTGLLWRIEGIDVPNPNHFGAMGASGGTVPLINNQTLKRSTFLTGGFPAFYGNALAGIFDLQLRSGNAEKFEHFFQVGFNGFEAGTEGPLKKDKSSYLINYRYSVPGLLSKVGVNFGTGSAIPEYQDLSLKIDVLANNKQNLSVFSVMGKSQIFFNQTDSFYSSSTETNNYSTTMGVAGFNYQLRISKKSSLKITSGYTRNIAYTENNKLLKDKTFEPLYHDNSKSEKIITHIQYFSKLNLFNRFSFGGILSRYFFRFDDKIWENKKEISLRKSQGETNLYQAYSNWQYQAPKLSVNMGLHYTFLALNSKYTIEPRLNAAYTFSNQSKMAVSISKHSRMQDMLIYFNRSLVSDSPELPNRNLDFSKSYHAIFSYDFRLKPLIVKAEAYYQYLYSVPIEAKNSYWSLINQGSEFFSPSLTNLVNNGIGKNYGVELSIEKPFENNFYILSTFSLFDSKYQTFDNIWRNTSFNNHFVGNLLGGYEWHLRKKSTLSFDFRATYAGGKRYTPIDTEASDAAKEVVYISQLAYSKTMKPYFRPDFKVSFRKNSKKAAFEWSIDIQNFANHTNMFSFSYNPETHRYFYTTQMGRYIVFNHKIFF